MTLAEAIAVEMEVSALGYPLRHQLAARTEARRIIALAAEAAIERHRSRAKATNDRPESNGEQPLRGL